MDATDYKIVHELNQNARLSMKLDEFITNLSEHVEYKLSIVLKNTLK